MCYEWEIWEQVPEKTREDARPVKKETTPAVQPATPNKPVTEKPAPAEPELEPA